MALLSYASGVFTIATWPARIAWKPVAFFINVILILLSPLLLMATFVLGWCQSVIDFIASLQPLYTFLACGACIGILAGLTMACTSGIITSVLGMHDERSSSFSTTPMPGTPLSERPGTGKTEDSSSYETDWQLLNKPPPKRRRRTPGLWSQTIHEEDDDDSEI
ncbi:hypothetical protein HER10_EVM0011657 [Colletotrichum scovillei]|uniref:Uncharacterized protein n=3 Tax=Colletotrichum acutatum species complex TaxID=2707335 RepID=A0A9P7RGZ4_9PEZI|nr:uncharacterized protein HER10_EVM0011657 [Colletotrichum scovillei]KXH28170.1 hypothetical protein CSIM01_09103 [Colletotrichum simmondsii]KXH43505.1 hypothetical protein CNYM01_08860 [Colletotrichum nymphaeae SA-01]KAF4780405.1 hypothetical protein HER10_EVM0011657 [Colletotrichum scovillei]KAG7058071.1 hypothetical protein JMJ77_0005449 [Colletotrichum scovillei]KAG7076647.1 hypothetical protein JMJ76_0013908 [Colletotrichum scovillei]